MVTNLAANVRAFTSNVFLVQGEETALVDPGANFDVVSAIEDRVGDLDRVVLTHTHPDHVGNLQSVVEAFDAEVWGFDGARGDVDHAIEDEQRVRIGDHDYLALHTPGHKDDHLCFLSTAASTLFAGDLVFQNGGFGRTDLEEGDRRTLIDSIDRLLAHTPEDLGEMQVGHGPSVYQRPYDHIELAGRMARET